MARSPDHDVSSKTPHHHGNLREALIDAGLMLLARDGMAGLTLRKCAALAGVSHAAPAHHFHGLNGLRNAIATRGFVIFADSMEEQAARCSQDPRARLHAICVAYVDFARRNPALFDLIFRGTWPHGGDDVDLAAAGTRAYGILAQACAPFVPAGAAPEIIETQVWSLVHGYASLLLSGKLGQNRPQAALDTVLALLDRLEMRA